jgi:hypothetical protein
MYQTIRWLHPGLAVLLLILYGLLAWRQWNARGTPLSPLYRTLARASRLLLLLEYAVGYMLFSVNRLPVSDWHHYASLMPVLVIFFFQFLPSLLKRRLSEKTLAAMWLCMFIALAIISAVTHVY